MSDESNAPVEISSKKRIGVYRQVVPIKRRKRADPRFDDRFGTVKPSFERNYEFIDDIKQEELKKITAQVKSKQLVDEHKEQLVKAKNILQDQLRTKKNKKALEEIKQKKRKEEASLVAQGKKPFYAKKSVLKEAVREKQYEELNSKGQLEKWMAKKSKRKASKQRKQMPRRRMQSAGE